jgi:general secretion pathway protein J
MKPRQAAAAARGFTLVEVLVALMIMAILATLTWQGLAGMLRARDGTREALDRALRLNTAVVQLEQDLQALVDVAVVPPLTFSGQTLLLTRRADAGVALVAWTVRAGLWQRWAGPVLARTSDLQEAWLDAQGLLGNEPGHVTVAEAVADWQLYKYVGGRKANMQSTGDVVLPSAAPPPVPASGASAPAPASAVVGREALPQAVEMTITIDGRTLTRIVGLGPGGS